MSNRPTTAEAIASMQATLQAKMHADERDRVEAQEQRNRMAADIAAIRSDASSIDHRVTNIEGDMAKVKPVIAKVNSWQSMALGGAIVLGLLGGAVTMFWEAVRDKIISMFSGG
ncbi:DUF1515 family protein [Sulfitobacter sp. 20_GPM-1509m]|uniref:DUF1515 family protein n=1 Tax=Sulfitobacter sp. 20_GPM-1509m TaxID=1380367 RepID=UPI00048CF3C0|nr:DUF1515 family protein [Sulfitobacter sp. 20_GPM-1509m]